MYCGTSARSSPRCHRSSSEPEAHRSPVTRPRPAAYGSYTPSRRHQASQRPTALTTKEAIILCCSIVFYCFHRPDDWSGSWAGHRKVKHFLSQHILIYLQTTDHIPIFLGYMDI